jgi:DNA adenine methylase
MTPSSLDRYFTPLRYPGGKAKLAPYVKAILEKNELLDGHYAEAYAGGAAVAMELLLHEYVSHIHINDISKPLYQFWTSVLDRTDEVSRKIRDTRLSVPSWDRQKRIFQRPNDHDDLEVGFAFFFLNRTNRSGILRAGIIGGRDQSGKWKIDARYNPPELIARVEAIAMLRDRVSVYNEDAMAFIRRLLPELPEKSLIYLDPPYYVKGKDLYLDYYDHDDHRRIANYIGRVQRKNWIVSYDDVEAVRALYAPFRGIQYELNYSARESRTGTEVMYFCDGLRIPRSAESFARLARIDRRQYRAGRGRARATA